jgi:hypothetical protein
VGSLGYMIQELQIKFAEVMSHLICSTYYWVQGAQQWCT